MSRIATHEFQETNSLSLLLEEGEVSNQVEEDVVGVRPAPASLRRCHRCGAALTEVQTLLDSRTGRSLTIRRCRCGEQSWSDEA